MIPSLTEEPGALELAGRIRAGEQSPLEAVDAAIARIERLDGPINAVVVRDFDRARDAAKALDGAAPGEDQPLFGVPMTIKESFGIAGLPSTWGEERFAGNVADTDARVVRQLKAAGAIFLGKTNIPPQLADIQSANPVYGRTNNPHDLSRVPGGSSGGAAAAVASGMVPLEYGTDIGGSVRVPAHFCGVWGQKTSWGLIDLEGHEYPMLKSGGHDTALSIAGPLARNAADLDLAICLTATRPLERRAGPLSGRRFLLVLDHPDCPLDDAVRGPIEAAAQAIEAAGAEVDRSSDLLPDLSAERADYMRMLGIAMSRGMQPGADGKRALATDWFNLLDAQWRSERAWERLFESYDFVLAPPMAFLAFEHDERDMRERTVRINGADVPMGAGFGYSALATFPNLPSTCMPVGSTDGLPCGMQVIGPRWADRDCISIAAKIADILPG
ncbi:amidase family protein [Alteriqipengyuania flavescens]|uniref:amidase family protein n=1 Tax=Alteriqipengyuania flavescens TaxID=3053610 RepID=UPI0025B349D3|nr:amidase family protein [Alteriqipengyuania flavescens]WJY17953.1 amidase family protein [Alteriqipengyuania flavescens]WJY23894.1 amidase family protein [Alteriqipengyuania flavescens]